MTTAEQVPKEEFQALLLTRRALLVNLAAQQPIAVQGITLWEQVVCVGYHPQSAELEAVVTVKLAIGYSGGLCTAGSPEYVRFFVDYGTGFEDAGVASFRAHDISDAPPGPQHPLQYLVHLRLSDETRRKLCNAPVLPKVRAILSWNRLPPLDPDWLPIYGNRLDAYIQLEPKAPKILDLLAEGVLEKASPLLAKVNLEAVLTPVLPKPTPVTELAAVYRRAKVPDHRWLFPMLAPLLVEGKVTPTPALPIPELAEFKKLDLNVAAVIEAVLQPKADTTYEQVTCVGLETEADLLGAVIHVKLPSGYSGALCHQGSVEYVAFWADWNNNGTFDEYLGTAQVNVHDITPLPAGGLHYAVSLPCPQIAQHLRSCDLPNIVRIRAVLSWSTPPSTTNPNVLNHWGNRLDVLVQLRPGKPIGTDLVDLIYRVGGVGLPDISPATFLAFPSAGVLVSANCAQPAMDRPFAGAVSVQGRIYNTGTPGSVRFRVRYKKHADADVDANWHPVTFSQTFVLMHPLLLPPEQVVALNSPDGWFDYLEDPTASPPIFERDNLLAWWSTGALEGAYNLRLEYYRVSAPLVIHQSATVTIMLDNTNYIRTLIPAPVLDLSQTLDLVIDGGDCHSYEKGATINGHLRAVDTHFWKWTLDIQPASHTHGAATVPPCRSYGSLVDDGDGNAVWSLDTSPLDKCGYALTLAAYDRAIVNSNGAVVHWNYKAVGFSIV